MVLAESSLDADKSCTGPFLSGGKASAGTNH